MEVSVERARWALSSSTAAGALCDASAAVQVLTAENAALRLALEALTARSAETTAVAWRAEERARIAQFAAETREKGLIDKIGQTVYENEITLSTRRLESNAELANVNGQLRIKSLELDKFSDWAAMRDLAAATIAAKDEELASVREAAANNVSSLVRRNAVDRADSRHVMTEQLQAAKRALVFKTASALGDTTRRVISEHGALLDELVFTSTRAELLLAKNGELVTEIATITRVVKLKAEELGAVHERNGALRAALRDARAALAKELESRRSASAAAAAGHHARATAAGAEEASFGPGLDLSLGPGLDLTELSRAAHEVEQGDGDGDGLGLYGIDSLGISEALPRHTPEPVAHKTTPLRPNASQLSATCAGAGMESGLTVRTGGRVSALPVAGRTTVGFSLSTFNTASASSQLSQHSPAQQQTPNVPRARTLNFTPILVPFIKLPGAARMGTGTGQGAGGGSPTQRLPPSQGMMILPHPSHSPSHASRLPPPPSHDSIACCDAALSLPRALDALAALSEERLEARATGGALMSFLLATAWELRVTIEEATTKAAATPRGIAAAAAASASASAESVLGATDASVGGAAKALQSLDVAAEAALADAPHLSALLALLVGVLRRARAHAAAVALTELNVGDGERGGGGQQAQPLAAALRAFSATNGDSIRSATNPFIKR